MHDLNRSGFLDYRELRGALRHYGINTSDLEAAPHIAKMRCERDGRNSTGRSQFQIALRCMLRSSPWHRTDGALLPLFVLVRQQLECNQAHKTAVLLRWWRCSRLDSPAPHLSVPCRRLTSFAAMTTIPMGRWTSTSSTSSFGTRLQKCARGTCVGSLVYSSCRSMLARLQSQDCVLMAPQAGKLPSLSVPEDMLLAHVDNAHPQVQDLSALRLAGVTAPVAADLVRYPDVPDDLRAAFHFFDSNHSGFLDYRELRQAPPRVVLSLQPYTLQRRKSNMLAFEYSTKMPPSGQALVYYGIDTSVRSTAALLSQYDDNPDGKLDLGEFDQLVRSTAKRRREVQTWESKQTHICNDDLSCRSPLTPRPCLKKPSLFKPFVSSLPRSRLSPTLALL